MYPTHHNIFRRLSRRGGLALSVGIPALTLMLAGGMAHTTPLPIPTTSFVAFESGQVRPLTMTPDRKRLIAVNTPDNRIEIFRITENGLRWTNSVPVGMEPVAVAARSNDEVWVVNHLSDSVSVVDLDSDVPHVKHTLLVGDEPRDIVFAGDDKKRAFITTAHRGQNNPKDPQLTTPGIGRADVWVFDAEYLGFNHALGGTPLTVLTLFTDTPRALAVSPDGKMVYAAGFHTGNQTTTITEGAVCDGGISAQPCKPSDSVVGLPTVEYEATAPGGLPPPNADLDGVRAPEVGLIVKFNGSHWADELNRSWDSMVRFSLPDKDVFAIDATARTPKVVRSFAQVGTVLFNMVVNPVNGKVYVSNTEAINEVRFEGERPQGSNITTVQGRLHLSRISVIDGNQVRSRHLNKHIDYSVRPAPSSVREKSLGLPTGMEISRDGKTLYLAAFGSSKVGIFNTAQLENNSFVPNTADQIKVSGGGPSGLVLDEGRDRLYVLTRFNNSVAVINTRKRKEVASYSMFNPEPTRVVNGRRFLYDTSHSSSNGEQSCASCHVFGDFDSLAWDLGNPLASVTKMPGPFTPLGPFGDTGVLQPLVHAMKGPMTTQSLRGLANQGPMHWRGDRTGGDDAPSVQPDGGSYDEDAGFKKFNAAFISLVGREAQLPEQEMQAFTDFMLEVRYPPNPIRALDNLLTPDQQAGKDFFVNAISTTTLTCEACHRIDPSRGFFGADGNLGFTGQPQMTKTTHLRNMYQKVGMWGMPVVPLFRSPQVDANPLNQFLGDQVRGFGFLHDGSTDTLFRFNRAGLFAFPSDVERRQNEAFSLAMDSDLAPIVGQQVTLNKQNAGIVGQRVDLMIQRAAARECDVIVKGVIDDMSRGWYRKSDGQFRSDMANEPLKNEAALRKLAKKSGQELTYTCAPPGSGVRMGVDRNLNGILDGDEGQDGDED